MTDRERALYAVAFNTTRQIEVVLAFPRRIRARIFFEVLHVIKRGLEEFSKRAAE